MTVYTSDESPGEITKNKREEINEKMLNKIGSDEWDNLSLSERLGMKNSQNKSGSRSSRAQRRKSDDDFEAVLKKTNQGGGLTSPSINSPRNNNSSPRNMMGKSTSFKFQDDDLSEMTTVRTFKPNTENNQIPEWKKKEKLNLRINKIKGINSGRPSTCPDLSSRLGGGTRDVDLSLFHFDPKKCKKTPIKHEIDIVGLERRERHPNSNLLIKPTLEYLNSAEAANAAGPGHGGGGHGRRPKTSNARSRSSKSSVSSDDTQQRTIHSHHNYQMKYTPAMHQQGVEKHSHIIRYAHKNIDLTDLSLVSSFFRRAFHYERLGKLSKAINDYNKCIQLDNQCSAAYFNRGILKYTSGLPVKEAIKDLDIAIQISPENPRYYENRAMLLRLSGQFIQCANDIDRKRRLLKNEDYRNILHTHSSLDPLKQIMLRDPRFRSDQQMRKLATGLKNLKALDFLHDDFESLLSIAQAVTLKEFSEGKYIFREGDIGTINYYVLYQGQLHITKNIHSNQSKVQQEKLLKKLHRGDGFGEAAHISGAKQRSANVVVSQDAQVLVIPFNVYSTIIQKHEEFFEKHYLKTINKCTAFRSWDPKMMKNLLRKCRVKLFEAETTIYEQGDHLRELYVVKRGVVNVIKPTPKKLCNKSFERKVHQYKDANHRCFFKSETPGYWVLSDNWKDRIEMSFDTRKSKAKKKSTNDFVVGVLCSGQLIGELCVLDPDVPCPVTLIAKTNVEILAFKREDLLALDAKFNSDTVNALNTSLDLHNPSIEKLGYNFRNKLDWTEMKDGILNSVMSKSWVKNKTDIMEKHYSEKRKRLPSV